jgi:hypothetical protein
LTIQVNMLDFLRTADFGDVKLGMNREEIYHLLGEPPDWSITRRRKYPHDAAIWRYGSIEFYFADIDDTLNMIYSDHFPVEDSANLILGAWILRPELPLDEALIPLRRVNLTFRQIIDSKIECTSLLFQSGVHLTFETTDDRISNDNRPLVLTTFHLR